MVRDAGRRAQGCHGQAGSVPELICALRSRTLDLLGARETAKLDIET